MKTAFTNYLPSNQNTNKCAVCQEKLILSTNCSCCGAVVCRNKCTQLIKNEDISERPWMSNFLGKNICFNCLPEYKTASDKYIKKIFAEIFTNDDDLKVSPKENEIENALNLQNQIENNDKKSLQNIDNTKTMDEFIKGILNDLYRHNNIKFTENGSLDSASIRAIVNSMEELINHPIMS